MEPGRTVREVVSSLGIVPETIAVVVVNEEQGTKDYVFREGDVVLVLAIICVGLLGSVAWHSSADREGRLNSRLNQPAAVQLALF